MAKTEINLDQRGLKEKSPKAQRSELELKTGKIFENESGTPEMGRPR